MFPNPQDALPLPLRPNLEQYKKQAKELVKACKSNDSNAVGAWAAQWLESRAALQGPRLTPQIRRWLQRPLDKLEKFGGDKLRHGSAKGTLAAAQCIIAGAPGLVRLPNL